jgi:radical SAM superfamily enzyme YgiQ (UPF0313 family)
MIKGASRHRRILFTTPVQRMPDYFGISIGRSLRISLPTPSFGLRFLAENVPGVKILEYPSWRGFRRAIRDLDVLGISYYMKDVPLVRRMVEYAREMGVREIWGGNYGVMCDETHALFDQVFVGYGERELYSEVNGGDLEPTAIRHPLLDTRIGVRFAPLWTRYGFLFTTRGCNHRCTFCQSVPFVKTEKQLISLQAIDDVLQRYKQRHVTFVFIMDENFMYDRRHAEAVIDLLHCHGFAWGVCTRAENLAGRVEAYRAKGMMDCIIGIESLQQENLRLVRKGSRVELLLDTIRELQAHDIYIHATHMIGYENQDRQAIREEIDALSELALDSVQTCVLTPFPGTALWDDLQRRFGLRGHYEDFDAYHLAWNHPYISKAEMQELLDWARRRLYRSRNIARGLQKLRRNGILARSELVPLPH